MRSIGTAVGVITGAFVSSCQPIAEGQRGASEEIFTGIAVDEAIRLIGTEPFWGGTIEADRFLYTTPENQTGEAITVKRFAGNSGLGFAGTLGSKPLDLVVTRGTCSDGMSDRTYPYTATLRIDTEQRNGCAWTARQPFTGPTNP